MKLPIVLVGDYDARVTAHQAIERSLQLASATTPGLTWKWIHTTAVETDSGQLTDAAGVWVVPASPYASLTGALLAIQFARESQRPFLGTCGGFQHALLEYARNVLHLEEAEHTELTPDAAMPLISPLSCSLVEQRGEVHLVPGSSLERMFGAPSTNEGYHCSYGLNPAYAGLFEQGPLKVAARDNAGEVRAMQLEGHPFFVITLFQPERAALEGRLHPVVQAFLEAAGEQQLHLAEARKPAESAGENREILANPSD